MNITKSGRISRTIGKKDTINISRKNIRGFSRRRHHFDPETSLSQTAKDVLFDAEVVSNDVVPCLNQRSKGSQRSTLTILARARHIPLTTFQILRIPDIRLGGGHFLYKIASAHGRAFLAASTACSGVISVVMTDCIAPRVRRCFVNARVSMPWIPGIFQRFK